MAKQSLIPQFSAERILTLRMTSTGHLRRQQKARMSEWAGRVCELGPCLAHLCQDSIAGDRVTSGSRRYRIHRKQPLSREGPRLLPDGSPYLVFTSVATRCVFRTGGGGGSSCPALC